MKKYEYKMIETYLNKAVWRLNEQGKDGWRGSIIGQPYSKSPTLPEYVTLFFEREIDDSTLGTK